jgi:hypothetical protein
MNLKSEFKSDFCDLTCDLLHYQFKNKKIE